MQLELILKPGNKLVRIAVQRGGKLVLNNALELQAACLLMRAFMTARFVFKGEREKLHFGIISEVGWLSANEERIACKLPCSAREEKMRERAHKKALVSAWRMFRSDRLAVESAIASYLESGGLALRNTVGLSGQLFSVKREGKIVGMRTCISPRIVEPRAALDIYQELRQLLGAIRWDCAAVQAAGGVIAFIAPCAMGFTRGTYRNGRLIMAFEDGVASFPSNACDTRALNTLFEQVICLQDGSNANSQ